MGTASSSPSDQSSSGYTPPSSFPVLKSPAEWKKQLTSEQYAILRESSTERPFTGSLPKLPPSSPPTQRNTTDNDNDNSAGHSYLCVGCSNPLFHPSAKFDSGCGWPAFHSPVQPSAVVRVPDNSIPGRLRTEVVCSQCGGHLGHVFQNEGWKVPGGERYCINAGVLAAPSLADPSADLSQPSHDTSAPNPSKNTNES